MKNMLKVDIYLVRVKCGYLFNYGDEDNPDWGATFKVNANRFYSKTDASNALKESKLEGYVVRLFDD
jgi:hypothetical protein